jgi:hypothetical protein
MNNPTITDEKGSKASFARAILRCLLYLVLSFSMGFLSWVVSSRIPVEYDESELETVGLIVRSGWPFWFMEQAPGISIMSSFKPDRAMNNLVFWIAIWVLIFFAVHCFRSATTRRKATPVR